jgi:hypothetical protein
MNSMVAMMMSASAMSALQRSSAAGSEPHSERHRVQAQFARPGHVAPQQGPRALDGAGQMAVQRDDDD